MHPSRMTHIKRDISAQSYKRNNVTSGEKKKKKSPIRIVYGREILHDMATG